MDEDDELTVRPGKLGKDRKIGRKAARFTTLVTRAVQKAGGRGLGHGRRHTTRSAAGRGRHLARRDASRLHRRVVIKTRIVRHTGSRWRAAPLARHVRYLEREGVTKDGERAHMFDADGDHADVKRFAERCEDDRHHFRFIVSPEDAAELADLRAFTRDLMARAQDDLGTRLEWVAVDHWNTDNPHIHVLLRGKAADGSDLVIDAGYLTRGLRERAQALATLELGPRTEHQIETALQREVTAERWTSLDAALGRLAVQGDGVVDLRTGDEAHGPKFRSALLGRAATLERLGLADPAGVGRWRLHEDLQPTLRELAVRGDIIKTLHRAMSRSSDQVDPARLALHPDVPGDPVLGRLADRGLHDELTGSAYAVIEGVDGRTHHVRFRDLEAAGDAPIGSVVEVRTWTDRAQTVRTALAVRSDLSIEAQVTANGATWLDRRLLAKTPLPLADGFGQVVQDALERRVEHLVSQDLARRDDGKTTFKPGLLDTLQKRDLADAAAAIAAYDGLPLVSAVEGEPIAGIYRRRLDLASGRFAMIDDGLGFRLVPWRPALDASLGRHVSGVVAAKGQIDWSHDRARGPGL